MSYWISQTVDHNEENGKYKWWMMVQCTLMWPAASENNECETNGSWLLRSMERNHLTLSQSQSTSLFGGVDVPWSGSMIHVC
jgi:hypothetical protein